MQENPCLFGVALFDLDEHLGGLKLMGFREKLGHAIQGCEQQRQVTVGIRQQYADVEPGAAHFHGERVHGQGLVTPADQVFGLTRAQVELEEFEGGHGCGARIGSEFFQTFASIVGEAGALLDLCQMHLSGGILRGVIGHGFKFLDG
ncbi:MAG: hypothetical protein HC898_10605 [Phycisphaerales bacterium]|nr:hypothetical protein [Phycisphaerales bacterium]